MANTTVIKGNVIQITGLDADWNGSTETGLSNMRISSIQFNPSGADDEMIVHDGGIDGVTIFHMKSADVYDQKIRYYEPPIIANPVIDISDCTLATPADAKVLITIS